MGQAGQPVVAGCPLLYYVVVTSDTRGGNDTISIPYSPGISDGFLQGFYGVSMTLPIVQDGFFSETAGVYSGRTRTKTVRAPDVDETQMPAFNLTVYNESTGGTYAKTLAVRTYTVGGASLGTVGTGTPKKVFSVNACTTIVVEN